MSKFKLFGTAALVASALAGPAMAQEVIYNPGKCAQYYPNANCQNYGPGNPYSDPTYRAHQYGARQDRGWNDSYNRYNGGYGSGEVVVRRNGTACEPGTWVRGRDGRRYMCQ